jgi:predicted ATPase
MPTCASSNCPSSVFVGRDRELCNLAGALERAIAGTGGLTALLGEPGIGKSRLAAEIASEAQRRHAHVFWGYCLGSYDDRDFSLWIQIMRDCLRWLGSTKAELSQTPALSCLMPKVVELTDKFSAFRERNGAELESGLYEVMAGLLRSISESRPLLLILDDLHAADRLSLSLLPLLARDLRELRILIVITCRDGELRRAPELADTFAAPTLRDLQKN